MNHKGVEYTVVKSETPGFWHWRFRIGAVVKTGKTEANLQLLAVRRAQLLIDRALKSTEQSRTPEINNPATIMIATTRMPRPTKGSDQEYPIEPLRYGRAGP